MSHSFAGKVYCPSANTQSEVRHQLALIKYSSGVKNYAVEVKLLTDDYAIMTYNLSQKLHAKEILKGLAYLLQCSSLMYTFRVKPLLIPQLLFTMTEEHGDRLNHQESTVIG